MPFDWRTALHLEGAWEFTFGKFLYKKYNMFDMEPMDMILNETKEIRMSASKDLKQIVIYALYNVDVKVDTDLAKYDFIMVNLTDKLFAKPSVVSGKDMSVIKMSDFNIDMLYNITDPFKLKRN